MAKKQTKRLRSRNPVVNEALMSIPALTKWLKFPTNRSGLPQLHPLSITQVQTLLHLYLNGPQRISEIANGIGLASNTITDAVNALESYGRVTKTRSQTDGRAVLVSLTPSAVNITETIYGSQVAILEKSISQLSEKDGAAFAKGMRILADNANRWVDEANKAAD